MYNFLFFSRVPEEGQVLTGNDRYEGYSVDLIDAISKVLGFNYRFELTPDNKYGSYNKATKKWDGLVKQLLDRVGNVGAVNSSDFKYYIFLFFRKLTLPFVT